MNTYESYSSHMLPVSQENDHSWSTLGSEGQLAVDVYKVENTLWIVAPVAGVDPKDISVSVRDDLLTIKGQRHLPFSPSKVEESFLQESFFGSFSRSIILPVDVKSEFATAEYKFGVLCIRIPVRHVSGAIPITVVDE